jgi:predicted Ser/Thr protein kinase
LPSENLKTNLASIPANWIPYNQIEFTEQLGGGASGQVYKGYYNNMEVAIKVFETKFSEFEHEFKIIR